MAAVTEAAVIVAAVITAAVIVEAPVSAAAVPVFTVDQEAAATEVQDHITTMVHTTIMVHIITIMVRGIHLHHLHHTDTTMVGEVAVAADVLRLSFS